MMAGCRSRTAATSATAGGGSCSRGCCRGSGAEQAVLLLPCSLLRSRAAVQSMAATPAGNRLWELHPFAKGQFEGSCLQLFDLRCAHMLVDQLHTLLQLLSFLVLNSILVIRVPGLVMIALCSQGSRALYDVDQRFGNQLLHRAYKYMAVGAHRSLLAALIVLHCNQGALPENHVPFRKFLGGKDTFALSASSVLHPYVIIRNVPGNLLQVRPGDIQGWYLQQH
mmetsp:Transcript_13031/g.35471  ORF Transcript_13031/g.35471 Transcript_13031/m.35471 type:complete len:224 (-) Transcript_13031:109-780(-)